MNAFVGERGGERVPQGVDREPLVRKFSPSQERLKIAAVEVAGTLVPTAASQVQGFEVDDVVQCEHQRQGQAGADLAGGHRRQAGDPGVGGGIGDHQRRPQAGGDAAEHLVGHEDSTGKVGAVGFCYGGGVCNALAVAYPELAASVPFYGRQAPVEDVPKIQVPLLLHFAELDERINEGWPAYEAALREHGKVFEAHVYPGVNHGFHNDSTPRYDRVAAELAWQRTLDWFARYLA